VTDFFPFLGPWTTENIMPREVEDAATECDFVKACAVVGVPNPLWGEEVFAWVVLKSSFQESAALTSTLRAHLESRLADFKVSPIPRPPNKQCFESIIGCTLQLCRTLGTSLVRSDGSCALGVC